MQFEFGTATRILFGAGMFRQAGAIAKEYGKKALVIHANNSQYLEPLRGALRQHGLESVSQEVAGEPQIGTVTAGVELARQAGCEVVLSVGGGSVIDSGKAIAAMLANPGELLDYLEVVGRGKPLLHPALPFIAVPTTAGTGAEVTRNAVLASPQHRVKVSLRSLGMLPRVALVDPELTYDLPPAITAATGLDALTQLIEPLVCLKANPMTDGLCREGLHRAARSLRRAFEDGHDVSAREDMCVASLFGGLALANAGLGAVHGFAGPIGGMFSAPHGAVCAALLPHVMAANLEALRRKEASAPVLDRFSEIARILNGTSTATAEDGILWVRRLVEDLRIPGLGAYGITLFHASEIVEKAAKASSMKPNPVVLTRQELTEILRQAL